MFSGRFGERSRRSKQCFDQKYVDPDALSNVLVKNMLSRCIKQCFGNVLGMFSECFGDVFWMIWGCFWMIWGYFLDDLG